MSAYISRLRQSNIEHVRKYAESVAYMFGLKKLTDINEEVLIKEVLIKEDDKIDVPVVESESGFKPFYNADSLAMSSKLWLPSRKNLRKKKWDNVSKSCFHATKLVNYNPYAVLAQEDYVRYKPEPPNESNFAGEHIKVYFTKLQKNVVRQMFETSDRLYNKTIDYLNKCFEYKLNPANKYVIRGILIEEDPDKLTPYDVRAGAIMDAYKAHKSNIAKSAKNGTPFTLSHRTNESSIVLEPKAFKNDLFYPTVFKNAVKNATNKAKSRFSDRIATLAELKRLLVKIPELDEIYESEEKKVNSLIDYSSSLKIRYSEDIGVPKHACILMRVKGEQYTLVKPYKYIPTKIAGKRPVVSADPGLCSFLTYFSNEECGEFGKGIGTKLIKLRHRTNHLKKKLKNTATNRKRKGVEKAIIKSRQKIKNVVDELHWKTASYLTSNYEKIIIGKIGIQSIMKKPGGYNNKKSLLQLSHYKFRNRLIHKAHKHGSTVMVTTEEYTSKTCTNCGIIKGNQGASRTFNCPHCHLVFDRDIGGARNILLRALTAEQYKPLKNVKRLVA